MKYKQITILGIEYTVGVWPNFIRPRSMDGKGSYEHKVIIAKGHFRFKDEEDHPNNYGNDYFLKSKTIHTHDGKMDRFAEGVESIINSFIQEKDPSQRTEPIKSKEELKLEELGFE